MSFAELYFQEGNLSLSYVKNINVLCVYAFLTDLSIIYILFIFDGLHLGVESSSSKHIFRCLFMTPNFMF